KSVYWMVVPGMALQSDIARKTQPRGFAGSGDATNPPTNAKPMGSTISIRLASSMLWMRSRFSKTSTAVVATTTRIKPARDHARIAARRDVIWPDASARGPREGAQVSDGRLAICALVPCRHGGTPERDRYLPVHRHRRVDTAVERTWC